MIELRPKVFLTETQIQKRISQIGAEITADLAGEEVVAICTLKGSFIFFADLVRQIHAPVICEYLGTSSYGNQQVSSGEVKLTLDLQDPILDKNILIIEDIVDSGLTLRFLQNLLKTRNPKSIRTAALLVKETSLKTQVTVDYTGFNIHDEFVVGYGLDYAQRFRELPYIGIIENRN